MSVDQKHPCPDCHQCQWCSDDRCRLCLRTNNCRKKMTIAEQIALYERLNRPGQIPVSYQQQCHCKPANKIR